MIVVTGAAGFIGSNLIARLNQDGYHAIVAVDKFDRPYKVKNLTGLTTQLCIDRDLLFEWLAENFESVEFIFHLGARTDTAEWDSEVLNRLNTNYTKQLWKRCTLYGIPLLYASSAATYGAGEFGYDDDESKIPLLKPLNPYGVSKQVFDVWALQEERKPCFWVGLKFFNVYGHNEEHKGRMASMIFHAIRQIEETGKVKLFKSHHPDYKDGQQKRDFVYVEDVVDVCMFFMHHRKNSGIYNVGSGRARTFNELVRAIFTAMGRRTKIEYIDIPIDIRDKYQYFTEANISKLRSIGYDREFVMVEET
jgi:ADP-L-glycero-D-manno-heptose 6-epimerase